MTYKYTVVIATDNPNVAENVYTIGKSLGLYVNMSQSLKSEYSREAPYSAEGVKNQQ